MGLLHKAICLLLLTKLQSYNSDNWARAAVNYNGGGYTDWYLPNYYEMFHAAKMTASKAKILALQTAGDTSVDCMVCGNEPMFFATSTEVDAERVYIIRVVGSDDPVTYPNIYSWNGMTMYKSELYDLEALPQYGSGIQTLSTVTVRPIRDEYSNDTTLSEGDEYGGGIIFMINEPLAGDVITPPTATDMVNVWIVGNTEVYNTQYSPNTNAVAGGLQQAYYNSTWAPTTVLQAKRAMWSLIIIILYIVTEIHGY